MKAYHVGEIEEFGASATEPSSVKPKIVEVRGIQMGVYYFRGKFHAYENVCAHQGGPACEHRLFANTEWTTDPKSFKVRTYRSETRFNITCPWHGVEYDIETGISIANNRMRLRSFRVKVSNKKVFVVL